LFVLFTFLSIQYLQIDIPKYRLFTYIFYLIILFITIITIIKGNRISLPSRNVIIIIFIYFVWKFIALSYTPFLNQGVKNILDFIVFTTLSFFIIPSWLNREEFLKLIFTNILLICLLSIIGSNFVETEGNYFRVTSSGVLMRYTWLFIHPNIAGLYGMSLFLVSLLLFDIRRKIVFLVSTLLGVAIPFLTLSRTILVVIFIFMFLYFLRKLGLLQNRYIKLLTYSMICTLFFLIVMKNLDLLSYDRLNVLLSKRLEIWNSVIKSMDNVLIGEGLFLPGVNLVYSVAKDGFGLDGLFVNIIYDEGIIGLLIIIILFSIVFYTISKRKDNTSRISNYLLLVALIYSITETHFFINNIFTVFVLGTLSFSANKFKQIKIN
jgi:O-antigen ligase